jgi:hypothetical protein
MQHVQKAKAELDFCVGTMPIWSWNVFGTGERGDKDGYRTTGFEG